jgi:hypothetical protein
MKASDVLANAYAQTKIPLDQLPYSPAFESLCQKARDLGLEIQSHQQVWHDLLDLRKRGHLPRVGRISRN